jgi:hypothetical protein
MNVRIVVSRLLAVVALSAMSSMAVADPAADRAAMLDHLQQSRAAFLESITGLSEAQWNWKSAPDRWSIAECAEHITRTEAFLRELARGAVTTPMPAEGLAKSHGKWSVLLKAVTDRTGKFQAPEPLNPMKQGEARSREQIVRDFDFERGRTYEFTHSIADLTAYAAMHPAAQEVDLLGWLYFLSGHTLRHTAQIAEVKTVAGYPK